jgi:hypothetical protein
MRYRSRRSSSDVEDGPTDPKKSAHIEVLAKSSISRFDDPGGVEVERSRALDPDARADRAGRAFTRPVRRSSV